MKTLLTLILTFIFLNVHQNEYSKSDYFIKHNKVQSDYELFVKALCQLESSGNTNAIGKADDVGLFQIIPARLYNFNRRTGKNYSLNDRFNPTINQEIFDFYAYKIGIENHEEIARRWNRASNWKDEKGALYWKLVQKRYKKLKNHVNM